MKSLLLIYNQPIKSSSLEPGYLYSLACDEKPSYIYKNILTTKTIRIACTRGNVTYGHHDDLLIFKGIELVTEEDILAVKVWRQYKGL